MGPCVRRDDEGSAGLPDGQIKATNPLGLSRKVQSSRKKYSFSQRPQIKIKCAHPVPICADESAHTSAGFERLKGRYEAVNIKLDKCGGLTEGLAMARKAQTLGLKVMVGNMVGTSLAMAPAFVLGQLCDVVDLDGPIFLAKDRTPSITYTNGNVWSGEQVWGGAHA